MNSDGKIDVSMLESSRVCKSFLVGKCIYDMLDNTKESMGKCPKLHIEKHRLIYQTAKENGVAMPRKDYLLDYLQELSRFVHDCDMRVKIAEERLDYSPEDKQLLNDLARKVENLNTTIEIVQQELEIIQEQEKDIRKAIELNEKLKYYINERDSVSERYNSTLEKLNTIGQQKLQVCEVCGAYMLKVDTDRRLVDHFMGKIHLAYFDMRHTLQELKEKLNNENDM